MGKGFKDGELKIIKLPRLGLNIYIKIGNAESVGLLALYGPSFF